MKANNNSKVGAIRLEVNDPPIAVGGIFRCSSELLVGWKINDPPTAVGGILRRSSELLVAGS